MIHQFDKKKRVLFFPTSWANSVASWCAGVSSPNGTLRIKNTLTPKEGGVSLELDVNEERIASLALQAVENRTQFSDTERNLIKGMFQGATDQKILVYRNDLFGIDMEALRRNLGLDEDGEGKLQENQTDASTAGKAYDISTAALLAAKAPADTGLKALSQESDTEKIARIGGSSRAAREDHKHPLNIDTDSSGGYIAQIVKNGETIPFGSSTKYARADHTHDLPELDADDIWYGDLTVGEEIDELLETQLDHEARIEALESATPPTPTVPVTSVNGKTGAVMLTADDIAWSSGFSVGDGLDDYYTYFAHPLDGKAANLMVLTDGNGGIKANQISADNNNARYFRVAKGAAGTVTLGTIPSSDITDADCTSGGECLAYFDSNKHLKHLGDNGMTVSKLQRLEEFFDWVGSGSSTDGILNYLAFGEDAKPSKKKMVIFAKDDPNPSLVDFTAAELQPNAVGQDPDYDTQAKIAAASPLEVYSLVASDFNSGTTTESQASKIRRIGTSAKAAREDHKHPFPHPTAYNSGLKVTHTAYGSDTPWTTGEYPRDPYGWERDKATSGWQTGFSGVRLLCVTRIERNDDEDCFYTRFIYFDKNGCLMKIDPENTYVFREKNWTYEPW